MRTGEVEADLVTLNNDLKLSYVSELIACKLDGSEKVILNDIDIAFFSESSSDYATNWNGHTRQVIYRKLPPVNRH